ncbi:MAG TPA: MBL fold metallo-hydrolase [Armatimonadota bacterium]|jgi:glyoxylase-like metal-dependent hydrolase (beta-lactamase superfamily II)
MTTAEAPAWFNVIEVSSGVWRINNRGHVNIYLIAGTDRALLIDTGWGIGDLRGVVETLTALPLTVVNTHGHVDHVFGNWQFPDALLDPADIPMAQENYTVERHRMALQRLGSPYPRGFSPDDWVATLAPPFQPLPTDYAFALGGRTVRSIPVPGHTPGAVCLLDDVSRTLFAGDSVLQGPVLLHLPGALPLADYAASLDRLSAFLPHFDTVYPGHGPVPQPASRVNDLRQGVRAILNGEVVGDSTQTPLGDGYLATFPSTSILYRPDHLR